MSDSLNTKPKLLVIGDALQDIYLEGTWSPRNGAQRFKPDTISTFDGGAANTYENAKAILKDKAEVLRWTNPLPLKLYRFIELETTECYIEPVHKDYLFLPQKVYIPQPTGIIISDYNKGTVNKPIVDPCPIKEVPWIIVDSRYRSLHPDYLKLGRIKIWRCTGDEYDYDWAKQFDFVVHTDGPNTVFVWSMTGELNEYFIPFSKEYSVPKIKIVDTCGAGDTFTAMLAAQLLVGATVYSAIPLCIKAAQEVCMKKYTAITTEKL